MDEIHQIEFTELDDCVQIILENPLWERYGLDASSARQMFQTGFAAGATIFTASLRQMVIGFIWFDTHSAWGRSGYIRLIGVAKQYQNKKVGKSLMLAAEKKIAEQASEVFLLVSDFNEAAQRFYQRLGYQNIGCIPHYIRPEIDELIYYKKNIQREVR